MFQKIFKKYVLKSVLVLLTFALFSSISSCRSDDDNGNGNSRGDVTFKVIGSAGVEIGNVVYIIGTESHSETNITGSSWEKTVNVSTATGSSVGIGASATGTSSSTLKVQIIVNGNVVKESTSSGEVLSATTTHLF